ncbi:helix-turn-helix transcriptional regulator [Corallococcus exiguus]|uniref:helix-turn-helix domain-containing protein n=1 Tax=Corallococcus TaxID=83461 RepID=UPI000EDCCA74|nr:MULTISPECIES: helix-turn-helix transcriptional regulator [Corallococcus]NNB91908.1 helix-turn-helix transcriptional regulator [Corallococcus exiguus]NNC06041.1 helix-turn-helix transcriptional regulator [Corallococcus exiguus]NPC53038.1 helix-turn-helix transcriptional regulator [Corallococcus exiguus]RKH86327.1 XRE family transcriptional regulator [Corallococcus sp. AB032C]
MNEELGITIGTAARAAREHLGLTQAEVAERIGLVHPVYSRLERGKMLPSVPSLYRLCQELRVSPETLLGLTPAGEVRKGAKKPSPREDGDAPDLRRLLHLARKLDAEKLDALLHVASALAR